MPPVVLSPNQEVTHYTRDGNSVMALGRPITGTPWAVVVEFPDYVFLNQANRFLWRYSLIGVGLLLIGVAGTFLLTRNITRPLQSLTQAASAISSGDYSQSVGMRGDDELGELGRAFNTMTVKVRDSQLELERKIQEGRRTGDALRKSEERLQTVVDNLAEGLVISALDGQLISWNQSALEMLGFSNMEECLLRLPEFEKIFELSTLEGRSLRVEEWPLARIINGEHLRDLELCVRRKGADWE